MVTPEEMAALDLLVWLRSGEEASKRLQITQPTISRMSRRVLRTFGLAPIRNQGEWMFRGSEELLNLERQVHQAHRWGKGLPLRIDAQYYSGPLLLGSGLPHWITGNFDFLEIGLPLRLLRNCVLDAWIGCHPDVPAEDDPEFACFHLTRLPTHLVVAPDHPLVSLGADISIEDVHAYPSLALPDGAFPEIQRQLEALGLWNSPSRVRRYAFARWEGRTADQLTVGYATAFTIHLFSTPQVILPLAIPLTVGDTLVVTRRYQDHPRLLELVVLLRRRAIELARLYPEVVLV